jgi:hypothetical protein
MSSDRRTAPLIHSVTNSSTLLTPLLSLYPSSLHNRYSEHIAETATALSDSARAASVPARLRWKLARLLVDEHERFPEPDRMLDRNRCAVCGIAEGLPSWAGVLCELVLACDSGPGGCSDGKEDL